MKHNGRPGYYSERLDRYLGCGNPNIGLFHSSLVVHVKLLLFRRETDCRSSPTSGSTKTEMRNLLMSCVPVGFSGNNILLPKATFHAAEFILRGTSLDFIRVAGLIKGYFTKGMQNRS